ncbi:hypothetical protein BBW65_07575 [Helicobacter enhydrae]|uniref:Hydroxyethylthiazole kinase n=1 Tax=Helicobacter enhydrae TaxID=222136 RepID=A0A1B1U7L4_9HELI|nr:hydroxyethylthiazole kinase [Helicobacter enhydrae]ANV98665.1 hypothetical protein BBW65_07575 [Helicobacter enhydrae]
MIDRIRTRNPLVHHLTNSVTINDCANVTLAMGGSPMMSDFLEEQEDFANIGDALVLNTGTLNKNQIAIMQEALKQYHQLKKPIILDPVALGVSKSRDMLNFLLLDSEGIGIIKGNASEIAKVIGLEGKSRGTDSLEVVSETFLVKAQQYCHQTKRILAVTGKIDWVISKNKIAKIENGSPLATKITGAGCMCASLCGVFAGGNEDLFESAIYALVSFGIASELSAVRSALLGDFRTHLLNILSVFDNTLFEQYQRYVIL